MKAEERHAKFNPGPATRPKGINFYGAFRYGVARKRFAAHEAALALAAKVEAAHVAALVENETKGDVK